MNQNTLAILALSLFSCGTDNVSYNKESQQSSQQSENATQSDESAIKEINNPKNDKPHQGSTSTASPTMASNLEEWQNDILTSHNTARKQALSTMNDLEWSNELQEYAQNWADSLADNNCDFYHNPDNNRFGENLALGSTSNFNNKGLIKLWIEERNHYNYNSNSCQPGQVCGHYTQVVWKDTQKVGCGTSQCQYGGSNVTILVCNYFPAGNIVGVKPY